MSKSLRWVAGCLAAILGFLLLPFAVPVMGKVGGVTAFASGTVVHADLMRSGATKLVDAEVAFSGAAFDSGTLDAAIFNEMDRALAPKLKGKVAYALGSPIEVGLGVAPDTENQAIVAGKAESVAPPNVKPISTAAGPIDLDPLVWADLLRGQSAANAADGKCALGTDASRGLAYVADAQLLDTASSTARSSSSTKSSAASPVAAPEPVGSVVDTVTKPASGLLSSVRQAVQQPASAPTKPASTSSSSNAKTTQTQAAPNVDGLEQPVIALDADGPARAISQSRSRTLFVAQRGRDGQRLGGAFGMMSEVRETIAPVTLFKGTDNELTLEFLGEWVLQAVAGGVPGTSYIHYGPGKVSPDTPVLRLIDASGVTKILSLQDLFGNDGFVVEIPGVAEIAIGEPPRAIDGAAGSHPTITSDGTKTSAAVDVVRVRVLPGAPVQIADLRVGHMEVQTQVPLGGVSCSIPVNKTPSAKSVNVGDAFDVTFTVTNPYDCTLSNVRLDDDITTEEDARFTVKATEGGATDVTRGLDLLKGNITWANVGDIAPHESHKVMATIGALGGAGAISDIATATGTLTGCAGPGADIAGVDVGVVATALHGVSQQVRVPTVGTKVLARFSERGRLPHTGAPVMLMVIASLALIGVGSTGLLVARHMR